MDKINIDEEFYGGSFDYNDTKRMGFMSWGAAHNYVETWCNENCNGWFYIDPNENDRQLFQITFAEAEDFLAFKLRWL